MLVRLEQSHMPVSRSDSDTPHQAHSYHHYDQACEMYERKACLENNVRNNRWLKLLKQCAFSPLLRSQMAYNKQPCRRIGRKEQENRKHPTRAHQINLDNKHTWLRKGRMMNHLSPTCLSPRSWSVKFSNGTRGSAFVPMSEICAAVRHCVMLIDSSWIGFWIKHTRRAMCLLRHRLSFGSA